mgnify:CR=1 FL=1
MSSIVLGLNDALVEITWALVSKLSRNVTYLVKVKMSLFSDIFSL